jgi:hypothetical protein
MPTLDDAPVVPELESSDLSPNDLIQIYDVSAQRPKVITVAEFYTAIADLFFEG